MNKKYMLSELEHDVLREVGERGAITKRDYSNIESEVDRASRLKSVDKLYALGYLDKVDVRAEEPKYVLSKEGKEKVAAYIQRTCRNSDVSGAMRDEITNEPKNLPEWLNNALKEFDKLIKELDEDIKKGRPPFSGGGEK